MRMYISYSLVFFVVLLLSIPGVSYAAFLYMDPERTEAHRGDTFTVAIRIDTDEGECINTVDATIEYSPNIRAVDVSRGRSILSLWVEDPTIIEKENKVQFAGGIPGGYCGRIPGDPVLSNIIAELVFRVPGLSVGTGGTVPIANITFGDNTQVLLNDGFGTPASLQMLGARATLLSSPGTSVEDDWNDAVVNDDVAPANFTIALTRDPVAFSGKYYIVFNSIDKQSGIDHYEVIEEPLEDIGLFKWGAVTAPWEETKSPYILKDQSLNSTVRVKAIDKAGNETIAVLVPDKALRSLSKQRLVTVSTLIGTAAVVLIVVLYALWRKRREVVVDITEDTQHGERT